MDKFLLNVLTNPLSKDVIETKRTNLLKSLRIVDDDEYCPVTVGTSRNIVKSINREFFNNLLELPKVKKGYLADNPNILAFYMSNDNVIYINCKAIAETSRFLDKFSAVKIKDQNLKLNIQGDITRMVTYVLEHELCHLALFKYAPDLSKKETTHGDTFRTLVYNLFGHGWGDFAFVHLGQYLQSGMSKAKFFELLNRPHEFDSEYKEAVYKRLWDATTLPNVYRMLRPKSGQGRNKTRRAPKKRITSSPL